jgi:hypothetical protein
MKGRNEFNSLERDKIIKLIEEKINAPINEQKQIRKDIREIGFYYSDFETGREEGGYTVDDFENLINKGRIIIKDDNK